MTTTLKTYIDRIPAMIPNGALAALNVIDLASAEVTGVLPAAHLPPVNNPVTSVFNRQGAITAQANDYSIDQINGAGALAKLGTLDLSTAYATGRVTYGKMPQVAAGKLIGNPGGSTADAQEIAIGAGLTFSGTTLAATGTPTVEVTTYPFQMAPNTRYITNMATLCTLILPISATQGSSILIDGKGAGGWKVAQNAGQTIHTYSDTTTGTTGSLASSSRYDNVVLITITADTDFEATARNGSLVVA